MSEHRTLKSVHLASTVWFIVCVGYILILALRQAGFNWWVIFSLSGHSALLIFLLISLYLFAVYRGVSGIPNIEIEHPLTSTDYYTFFYTSTPFLGGLAGLFGMLGVTKVNQFLLGVSMGTLGTTFLVWVIVDPLTGMVEMLLPTSRKHRADRLAQAEAKREERRKSRQRLLADLLEKEKAGRAHWQQILKPQAEKLATLLASDSISLEQAEREAVDLGANAWQIGGLNCMKQLHDMAVGISRQKNKKEALGEYISIWWDGIGTWRNPSIG